MTNREEQFRRNERLESLLSELNNLLTPAEESVLAQYQAPLYPIVIIVGVPRSGTTLLLQWLANTAQFAYPSNLLARFYNAPYIGARIQQLLLDPAYNFRDEFLDVVESVSFNSNLGKTQGILAPNEFWYFWRRFFNFNHTQKLDEAQLSLEALQIFKAELAALEAAFNKPLTMKGLIINWHLPLIAQLLPTAIFVHLVREPVFNAQSLLVARRKFYGSAETWYSFKPPEYETLKAHDIYYQVAGQVYYINQAIEQGLTAIPATRKTEITYETFCRQPQILWQNIIALIADQTDKLSLTYRGPDNFACRNKITVSSFEEEKIIQACHHFFSRNAKQLPNN